MSELQEITTQQVSAKLKGSFKRIKEMWEKTNKAISKNEKKIEKINEYLYEQKMMREDLEDELEGIRSTYEKFCEETGQKYDLN